MNIDKTSLKFSQDVELLINEIANEFVELSAVVDREQLIQVLGELDMEKFILDEMGFEASINEIMSVYPRILEGTQFFQNISSDTLNALVNFDVDGNSNASKLGLYTLSYGLNVLRAA